MLTHATLSRNQPNGHGQVKAPERTINVRGLLLTHIDGRSGYRFSQNG